MAIIYHITTSREWNLAKQQGYYQTASLASEGFIHCCGEEQVSGVIERYFSNIPDLVKLVIDTNLLTSPFYFEWSPSVEDTFPHIYGAINLDAVKDTQVQL